MLRAHNSKTSQIINGFQKYFQLREKSKAEGIPFEQLIERDNIDILPVKKKKKILKSKPKVAEPQIEIMVKDKDGQVSNFAAENELTQDTNIGDDQQENETKIEAEETLQMIKSALKSKKKKSTKKGKKSA